MSTFDLADVPRDQFVVAGIAWRRCRTGADDPNRYGLSAVNEFGEWWIAANLVRDVAALAGLELGRRHHGRPREGADSRDLYERDDRLRVSTSVRTMAHAGRWETITSGRAT